MATLETICDVLKVDPRLCDDIHATFKRFYVFVYLAHLAPVRVQPVVQGAWGPLGGCCGLCVGPVIRVGVSNNHLSWKSKDYWNSLL